MVESVLEIFCPQGAYAHFYLFSAGRLFESQNRLIANGIPHRSRIVNWGSKQNMLQTRKMEYSIYVAKEDEQSAAEASSK
ncbi:hypothetical protein ACM1RC_00505 [Paenibacillus azoreducens]|uniref:hypothetical protein n=1 Tax=Paenibacillus azoreducens TaxID=116718 RepID=UPI0039F5DF37